MDTYLERLQTELSARGFDGALRLMHSAGGLVSPGAAQFALIAAGGLVMAGSVGPTDAVVIDVIHPGLRATAVSVLSLTRNLFGLAGGPLLAGALSDAYGLSFAMSVVPVLCLIAAVLFVLAARTYEADRKSIAAVEPALEIELKAQPA